MAASPFGECSGREAYRTDMDCNFHIVCHFGGYILECAQKKYFKLIVSLFFLNAIPNILWRFLFFTSHLFWWSIAEMAMLNVVNLALMSLLWKYEREPAPCFLRLIFFGFPLRPIWHIWLLLLIDTLSCQRIVCIISGSLYNIYIHI